jgi:DNA-binding FadR family transcriptional regulator
MFSRWFAGQPRSLAEGEELVQYRISITLAPHGRMPRLVAEDIAVALKQRISAGEWAARGRMPPERDLASEFGVARNTIRRAFDQLQEAGMLAREVGRGTFLMAETANSLAGVVARMEGASPADIMEIRRLLEPAAADFAATSASVSELNAIQEAHAAACDADDMPTFERWDAAFHQRIFLCSRNNFLREIHNLVQALRNQSPWFEMKRRSFSEERRRIYCAEHQIVIDALVQRDPHAAKEAMAVHLRTVADNLFGR